MFSPLRYENDLFMKKYIILIVAVTLLSGCGFNNISNTLSSEIGNVSGVSKEDNKNSEEILTLPTIIYSDDSYKVYSFNKGINGLDLNFDLIDDYIFVSHINGADYYDYHVTADRDIYNFFINHKRNAPLSSYWNIITKEMPGKKIDQFERDFVVQELLGCNGGGTLRIVQTKNNETLLVLIDENPKEEDGCNTRVRFNIYKLRTSGSIAGSDYIFSFVKEVVGESRGNSIEELGDKDIVSAIKKVNF